ncbi:MAG: hypothetical protein ABIO44_12455 [Saprospiraceae bacterium]
MKFILAIIFQWSWIVLNAQDLPKTNLYAIYLEDASSSDWHVNRIEFLNSFNLSSYNNQPFFINDDEVLCSVQTKTSDNTDIYKLNLSKQTYINLIQNIGKDYSPRINPKISFDITCVHIDPKDTIQKLVAFNSQNGSFKKVILDKVGQIGYYRLIDNDLWACFLVDSPNNLMAICNSKTKEKKIFASNIGRTFEAISNNEILFVHKILEDQWILKSYNIETQKMITLSNMPLHSEDFLIDAKGRIICTNDSKIMYYNNNNAHWEVLLNLQSLGISHLGRLALKNNILILVDEVK